MQKGKKRQKVLSLLLSSNFYFLALPITRHNSLPKNISFYRIKRYTRKVDMRNIYGNITYSSERNN